ncbi:response regulator [Mucilaginibacter ginsenosidivorans]|uniref:Response regulator transcription factor n=1 Tax=Mucilaginibacter ginsenosidivorans TaxID=398053 RepID=A0A5B8UYL1_9SPHI|nr:response regulator transcription factor [Mucilaginibacter ginsenosidivorans]QEC64018.1 response regulator transcription factor [Mucilaginibacter ginsenosidivorans]
MATKILIADDHSAIRIGVRQICTGEFPFVQFGEATNYAEVFQKLKESDWDIVILDIDLPGRNGLDVLKQIRADKCKVPVLMFSFHGEEQIALRALKMGASGYLSKDTADQELIKAINKILDGKKYVSPAVSERFLEMMDDDVMKEPHELLSDREYQTLLLIASGKTVSEIADMLYLSTPTISTYRARILAKMKLKNNAELTNYAISQKLV